MVTKIISGGQTGVDRAALDAAIECGVSIGGWCPRGRRAEDGQIDDQYPLRETPDASYKQRTHWNVRDSDGTLILLMDAPAAGGTAETLEACRRFAKPCLEVLLSAASRQPSLRDHSSSSAGDRMHAAAKSAHGAPDTVDSWLCREGVQVLNVAGPRASEFSDVYPAAFEYMRTLLRRQQ